MLELLEELLGELLEVQLGYQLEEEDILGILDILDILDIGLDSLRSFHKMVSLMLRVETKIC
jgi:hypothetical protein